MIEKIRRLLFEPVDVASLVFFRVAFGLIMLWEVRRYFARDWIARYWIEPDFNFTYPFFEWVKPWPGDGMYYHFYALGFLSFFILIGFYYRLSAALFFLGFTYQFLLEEARYLNHFYLVSLVSFLMIVVPAHRAFSVDAERKPSMSSRTIPRWPLILLGGQLGIAYFFAGIAKINADWVRGEPMRSWLASRLDFPVVGRFFAEEWAVYLMSYGGLLLDLAAVPLLLWRRTRVFMFALLVSFHFMNDRLFSIGIFPWFMIAATTIFFPADWPRRLYEDLWPRPNGRGARAIAGALLLAPVGVWFNQGRAAVPALVTALAGALIAWSLSAPREAAAVRAAPLDAAPRRRALVAALVGLWLLVQVAVPLRHLLVPGEVSWTEEGHRFSWHMKLRDKDGDVFFLARDPETGTEWEVDAFDWLEPWQYRKMATRPYMIHLFARHLARTYEEEGWPGVEIRVESLVSLNGRPPQSLIDPEVDLAREPFRWHQPWILPLRDGGVLVPLPRDRPSFETSLE